MTPNGLQVLAAMLMSGGVALAQEPPFLERVAERYARAETYCETGKWGMRTEPQHGFTETAFKGCAQRDGRFKYVEHIDRVAVFVLGFWCALWFGLLACFTLASYPMQWLFRHRLTASEVSSR